MPDQIAARADRLIAWLRMLDGNVAVFSHGDFSLALAAPWIGLPGVVGGSENRPTTRWRLAARPNDEGTRLMRLLIAGNWKMHGTGGQLAEIAAIASTAEATPSCADLLICPPATLIARAALAACGRVAIGGQDCSAEADGAFTGDISTGMLVDAGATAVIVGHSERRRYHGETGAMIAAKARAASRAGLLTIICIGESEAQRKAGGTLAVCDDQIAESLPDGMDLSAVAVAHEPLWSIGSGRMPTSREIVDVHQHIRKYLITRFGADGKSVRILYGGSIKPDNARDILALPDVNGALIGGASLRAEDFNAIVRAVAPTA